MNNTPENMYMKTVIGLLAAACLLSLTGANYNYPPESIPIVCPCQYKYDPVCGSDGITYMNKCVLDCTSQTNTKLGKSPIKMVGESECKDTCNCQKVDLPVCTLDGQTYPNECELSCENIKRKTNHQPIIYLAYRTACRGLPGQCTNVSFPVCGSDNVLYRNRCVLDYTNTYNSQFGLPLTTVKNNGACQDGSLCPITSQPVCATDGNIYNNPCKLEAENDRRKSYEETVYITEADQSVCNECRCPKDDEPVCCSDGNTYSNLCELDCAIKKQNNSNLKVMYKGACRNCECEEECRPVCGTDRRTYRNSCLLECENIGRSEKLPPLKVFHVGECQQFACDCSYCGESYQPACGSDGQTYWNLCWLQCNDRCNQKNGLAPIRCNKNEAC